MIEIWKILFITLFKQPLHRGSVPPSCFKPILLVSWPYCSSSFQQLHPVAKYEEDGASALAPEGFYPSKLPRQPSWLPRWSVTQEKSAHTLSLWHFKFNTWVLAEMREQRSLPWEPHFPYMVTGNIFHNVMQLTHFRTIHARAGLPHKRQTCILSGSCPSINKNLHTSYKWGYRDWLTGPCHSVRRGTKDTTPKSATLLCCCC